MKNISKNPWEKIDYRDYEKHMSHPDVKQLSALSLISKEQFEFHRPGKTLILGICTGNGLEHADLNYMDKVYGVDINNEYLKICRERFENLGKHLELYNIDLNSSVFKKDKADLITANLFLEYIPVERFLSQIDAVSEKDTAVSVVFQRNNENSFVSDTGITSLNILNIFDGIFSEEKMMNSFKRDGYSCIFDKTYKLPNKKELVRMDFKKKEAGLD